MSKKSPQQFEWAKNIPCRNIQIHGYCKWENKGCSFNHDMARELQTDKLQPGNKLHRAVPQSAASPTPSSPTTPNSSRNGKHFNFDNPAFRPSKFSQSTASLNEVPSFVPGASANGTPSASARFNPESAPVFTPGTPVPPPSVLSPDAGEGGGGGLGAGMSSIVAAAAAVAAVAAPPPPPFFQQTNLLPMNYHLYAPKPPPHIEMSKRPNERTADDLFIPDNLREYVQKKNEASLRAIPSSQLNLPLHVGPYHSLYPVDKHFDKTDAAFGYPSTVFKCVSNIDGRLYCMRRLEGVPITSAKFLEPVKQWALVDCANVVKVYDAFTSKAFGDTSLIVIYDYYPNSLNLTETHFYRIGEQDPQLITEEILWSYFVQLTNASAAVHSKGLFVGEYDPTKIIATNQGRIRLSSVAIADIVELSKDHNMFTNGNNSKDQKDRQVDVPAEQHKDLERMGTLILNFAKSTTFIKDPAKIDQDELFTKLHFSEQLKKMLRYALDPESTWERFQELLAPHILRVSNGFQNACDYMEANLTTEVENARLVRLLAKLDVISERPEFLKDQSWSETGERYPIKLFKDYVFHQVDESGKPIVDLTHIVNSLNKLDAGVEENILLVSPDEMSCLVLSYKKLKELIDGSFREVAG